MSARRGSFPSSTAGDENAGVAIVTDSSSSLPLELAREYGIHVVPINVQFGAETFKDGVELSHDEFYLRLEAGGVAKTSQPSPGDFIDVYSRLAGEVDHIISIHVTAKASGTVQSATLAASVIGGTSIDVVDSETTSMALGFIAILAAEAARLGRSAEEVLRVIEAAKKRVYAFAALPTLAYLQRSGKVGVGQALIAAVLSVKPILTMKDGLLQVIDRVRTYPKALARMVELCEQAVGSKPVRLAIVYGKTREEGLRLAESIRHRFRLKHEPIVTEIGPALASHGGPGILGIIACVE